MQFLATLNFLMALTFQTMGLRSGFLSAQSLYIARFSGQLDLLLQVIGFNCSQSKVHPHSRQRCTASIKGSVCPVKVVVSLLGQRFAGSDCRCYCTLLLHTLSVFLLEI